MYHRVVEEMPEMYQHWHYVTVSDFRKQLKLIDRLGFTTITFSDYQLYQEDKLTLPAKPIIITFDDGYMDTFENALPALVEMGMKAVIFVMGNRKLKRARWDETDEKDICRLMTCDQIKIAKNMEFEIGSHSLNHDRLSELSTEEAEYVIKKSKEEIESILNEPILTFAYPYGNFDERIEYLVSNSGYKYACGVYTGSPKFGETVYDIRRLAINQKTSFLSFFLKLTSPYQYLEWFYHQLKMRLEHRNPISFSRKINERKNEPIQYSSKIPESISK